MVASGLAEKCEVQLAYAIGVAKPVSVYVNSFGTGKIPDAKLAEIVCATFELTPSGIIRSLDLLKPIYCATASYGHFGRDNTSDGHFSWERTDKLEAVKKAA